MEELELHHIISPRVLSRAPPSSCPSLSLPLKKPTQETDRLIAEAKRKRCLARVAGVRAQSLWVCVCALLAGRPLRFFQTHRSRLFFLLLACMIAHGGRRNSRRNGGSPSPGSMASASSSHQNAAKKIKALLRRTHFPVARLRQLPVTSGGLAPSGSAGAGGAGGGGNPWDGIVSGDPRAALVVLHWTLLDMSPLFASLLLDRDYAGLNSLTDFKFVSTTLRMLRDEFNCRPQLSVREQRERERN